MVGLGDNKLWSHRAGLHADVQVQGRDKRAEQEETNVHWRRFGHGLAFRAAPVQTVQTVSRCQRADSLCQ